MGRIFLTFPYDVDADPQFRLHQSTQPLSYKRHPAVMLMTLRLPSLKLHTSVAWQKPKAGK